MAGRSIDLKKTVPFLKMRDLDSYGFGNLALSDIVKETEYDTKLEKYKGDAIDRCFDTPCCFTPGPNREFFVKYIPYFDDVRQKYPRYELKVLSAYKPFIDSCSTSIFEKSEDVAILMMADGLFAGAIYKEGEIVACKEIVSLKSARTSKSVKEDFRQKVKALLQKWEPQLNSSVFVFIRCTFDDKLYFFEGKGETAESKHRHIPFETGKPTLPEIGRVYDRLMRCEIHDTIQNTLKDLRNERKHLAGSVEVSTEANVENKRRMEKKMWPWMDASLAKRLVDYVENDNGNGLYDDVQAHSKKSQLLEYLNAGHEKFNGGSFLHFAVQQAAISVAEILLELGCDPTTPDSKNKVPLEHSKVGDMQEVFINFRSQNGGLFNWNKAKIPEKVDLPVQNERKKVIEAPSKKDVSRKKRSEKLKSKKVKNCEY